MSHFEVPDDVARTDGELVPAFPQTTRSLTPCEPVLVEPPASDMSADRAAEHLAVDTKALRLAHRKCVGAVKRSVLHARDAGNIALNLKHHLGHGKWKAFVRQQFRGEPSLRTVEAYMQIAKGWQILEAKAQRVALLTIRDALRLIAQNARENASELTSEASSDGPEPLALWTLVETVLSEIDLAPCMDTRCSTVPARHSFSAADGLNQDWSGRVFLSPPNGRELSKWVTKLRDAFPKRVTEALVLVAARTDAPTFQDLSEMAACLAFLRHPIDGETKAGPKLLAYLGDRVATFVEAVEEHATVLFPKPQ